MEGPRPPDTCVQRHDTPPDTLLAQGTRAPSAASDATGAVGSDGRPTGTLGRGAPASDSPAAAPSTAASDAAGGAGAGAGAGVTSAGTGAGVGAGAKADAAAAPGRVDGAGGFGQTWVTRSRDHVSVCQVTFYLCSFRRLSLKAFFSFAWSVKEMHNFGGTDLGCCGCRWCGNRNMRFKRKKK